MSEQALEDRVTRLEEGQKLTGSQFTVAALAIQKLSDEVNKANRAIFDLRGGMYQEIGTLRAEMHQRGNAIDANVKKLQHSIDQLTEDLPGIIAGALRRT